MAHHAPSPVCEHTEKIDDMLDIRDFVIDYLYENFPPMMSSHMRDLHPSDSFHHNEDLKLLARTIMGEHQLDESKRYGLQELIKEFNNRFRHMPRPESYEGAWELYMERIDKAWKQVFHWLHILVKAHTAIPVPESDLYVPALRRESKKGEIHKIIKCLGNKRIGPILFPSLHEDMESKNIIRSLEKADVHAPVFEKTRQIINYTIKYVHGEEVEDLHTPPSDGSLNAEQKIQLAFLGLFSTLLTPYVTPALLLELISELGSGNPPFSKLYETLVYTGNFPNIDHLSKEEQDRILFWRLNALRLFMLASPVIGIAILVKTHGK